MRNCITLFILAAVVAVAATRVYDVELSQNDNATTPEDGWVGQTFIATCDSIQWAAFFVGRACTSGTYKTEIWDSTGLQSRYGGGEVSAVDPQYQYVNAIFEDTAAVIKGVKYMLKVSHSGGDSVNYYYNDNNPYAYGELVVGGQKSPGLDLAARVEGVNWVPPLMFAAQSCMPLPESLWHGVRWDSANWFTLSKRHDSLGVRLDKIGMGYWENLQDSVPVPATSWKWYWVDSVVDFEARNGIQDYWQMNTCPRWARSCSAAAYPNATALPKNVYYPVTVNDTINRQNYWAYYCWAVARRYGAGGTFWQNRPGLDSFPIIFHSPFEEVMEQVCVTYPDIWDTASMKDTSGGWIDTAYVNRYCSYGKFKSFAAVYTRLIAVTDSAIRLANTRNKTLAYTVGNWMIPAGLTPDQYLGWFEEFGGNNSCYGLDYHDYYPSVSEFEINLDTITRAMFNHGLGDKCLWNTEGGYPSQIQKSGGNEARAESLRSSRLLKIYTTIMGSNPCLRKPVDVFVWFTSNRRYHADHDRGTYFDRYGITDDSASFNFHIPGWTYRQMSSRLSGVGFNRQLFNSLAAETSRIYEFLNPTTKTRTWVAWKKQDVGGPTIDIILPVKTDSAWKTKPQYSVALPESAPCEANSFGWLCVSVDTNPVYFSEVGDTSRPDMIVDSSWLSPNPPQVNNPVTFYARIKNVGNAAKKSFEPPVNDSVCFYVDGDKKSDTLIGARVGVGDTVTVQGRLTWTPAATGSYLLKATVNGSRVFMELSFDNNSKYRMYNVSYLPPTGSIVINKDSTFTNLPAVSLYLQSYNPNRSGNQPADSMTIWEVIPPDTIVQLSFGYVPFDSFKYYRLSRLTRGKKKFCVKYRITEGSLESSTYADSIVFDWTPPESIRFVVNHNRLFTPTRSCTLCSSVFDSTSGIYAMRFGNKLLANAVANSSCDDTSRWSRNNTDHDSSHKFFKVNSVSDQVSYLRQDIHKDTLAQWIDDGDTLLMSADLVTDHFVGTGNFRFQYLYGPPDPVKPDTVDTIITATDPVISPGSQAWVSRYNFPVALCFHPVPPNGTEFKKARVEVYVKSGGANAGSITVDNIRLEPIKPEYNYSRFVAYDSIKTGWLLKAGNGRQTVFAQFADQAGNETEVVNDTVVLDTTNPVCAITIPQDSQMVSSTLSIFGYAYDQSDTGRYFWKYNLDYRPDGNEIWYPIRPDSVSYTAVYFEPPGSWLGDWWTDSVTNHYHYDLKVLVKDSAGNQAEDTVYGVYVSNADPPGGDGDGFGGFGGEAEAMSLDKDGNLYLVSTETPADQIDLRIKKYSPTGESLLAFSAKLANDSTRIPWASAIVVDDSSRILVLDGLNNCLKVFDKTGKFLIKVGTRGSGQGQFINPSDLKWDRPYGTKTKLFIADKGNRRVQVLTKQGSFLRQFGTDSIPLNNPIALVHNSYNQTCVLDVQNDTGRLYVYDSTGKLKRTVTSFNLKNPTALSLDSRNNLFIADAGNKRILELSPILTHIYSFGTEGDSFGQFRNPTAMTVTKDSRYLYVYDRGKQTISKFTMIKSKKRSGGGGQSEELLEILPAQLLLYAPKPNPAKRLVTLKYAVPRPEKVSLIIYDIVGRQTRTITDKIHKPGFYSATWDGKDDRGRELSAGIYFCLLKDDEKILTKKVVLVR